MKRDYLENFKLKCVRISGDELQRSMFKIGDTFDAFFLNKHMKDHGVFHLLRPRIYEDGCSEFTGDLQNDTDYAVEIVDHTYIFQRQ